MKGRILDRVVAAEREHRSVALATDLATGRQLLFEGEHAEGDLTLDDAALDRVREGWRTGRNRTIETAAGRVFVEVLTPAHRCFIIGAVHIAQPLARMLTMADYAVTVIDPRGAFATQARFPDVELTQEWPDEALERLLPDRGSAVVALTHDPKLDDPALAAALRSDCFYIGALGSRRNHAGRCARLKELGFSDDDLARIHGPVGLAIGAVSPAEVAISIAAEMTQILRHGEAAEEIVKFGEVPVAEAEGAILAHSLKLGTTALKKARVLSPADVELIAASGLSRIVVARLEPGDVAEDEAARRVAEAAAGADIEAAAPFTGRANLFAKTRGLLVFDPKRLDRLNLVDETVTLGTLPPFARVEPKQIVATVKIIPFAAPETAVARCLEAAAADGPLLRVAPFVPRSVGLVQTRLPGLKESILDKTRQVTEGRLAALGCRLLFEERCAHATSELASTIRDALGYGIDILLIHGASAILDRRDVIPAAIIAAGGRVDHFGMPVDPGNLLLLGHVAERVVLGLPGCARSPKVNGFDWVLERLVAGLPVGSAEIMRMGNGGLLAEIPSRPLPRAEAKPAEQRPAARPAGPRIGALLLAAGQSRRMGGPNKLLAEVDGTPMVAHVARRLLASRARPIIAVLGNQAEAVDAALGKLPVERVRNPEFAGGLSTSLKRGIAALPPDLDGTLVCLGDMPLISGRHIDRLIAAFNPLEGRAIIVPTRRGKRGNPVLWSKRFFPDMAELAGDVGAKHLIGEHAELAAEVEMDDDAILVDIDTPEALEALRQKSNRIAGASASPLPFPPPQAGEG